MKKRECPSCAMNVDASNKECEICGYEFADTPVGYKLVAVMLILLFLFFMIF
jgi:hypothetical protein